MISLQHEKSTHLRHELFSINLIKSAVEVMIYTFQTVLHIMCINANKLHVRNLNLWQLLPLSQWETHVQQNLLISLI